MKQLRETQILSKSLNTIQKMGKVFWIVFTICSIFFAFITILSLVFTIYGKQDGASIYACIPALFQNLVMTSSFFVFSLISKHISNKVTPFSRRIIKMVLVLGFIFLLYTVFCLLYPIGFATFQLEGLGFNMEVFPNTDPGDIYINIESFIVSCAFFFFAFILQYGRTLQELNDETL